MTNTSITARIEAAELAETRLGVLALMTSSLPVGNSYIVQGGQLKMISNGNVVGSQTLLPLTQQEGQDPEAFKYVYRISLLAAGKVLAEDQARIAEQRARLLANSAKFQAKHLEEMAAYADQL